MAEELKPCPFCGGEASAEGYVRYTPALTDVWWPDGTVITDAFYVNCMNCGAVSRSGLTNGYQTRAEAIAAWNTRHTIPPTDEQVEALIEALRPFVDGYQHTAIFLRSREKMHSAGQELYAEDVSRARAALEAAERV